MPETSQTPAKAEQTSPIFQSLQREMNQFLDRFRGQSVTTPTEFFDALSNPLFPALDVVETEEAVEITAEVPGVEEDDLDVSITQNMLVLRGEKSNQHEETTQAIHHVERRYGSFRRQIPLGFMPDDDAVEATFNDGVLKLTIAKPEAARKSVQKIKISRA